MGTFDVYWSENWQKRVRWQINQKIVLKEIHLNETNSAKDHWIQAEIDVNM